MSNNKKANKSSKSTTSKAAEPVVVEVVEEVAKKQPETRAEKDARRLNNFLAEYGQALADAGIDTSSKTKVQLQAELGISQRATNPQPVEQPVQVFDELEELKRRLEEQQALLAQEQAVLWDEDLINHGAVVSPTEELSVPQEAATVVEELTQPEEVVTMNYKNEILAVVPGPASSVQEAIELAVKAAYQPDMTKVEAARDAVYVSSKGLLERAITRMRVEAEAQINKDLEAQLIAQAEADAQAKAIAEVMADNSDLGLTEEMLVALLEEERNLEASRLAAEEAAKAEAARVKAHARKQRELMAEVEANGMLEDAEKLAEELETLTNVSNAGALEGSARKIKQLAAAGKLNQPAVSNFVGQYRKAYMTWKSLTRVAPAAPVKREQQQAAD